MQPRPFLAVPTCEDDGPTSEAWHSEDSRPASVDMGGDGPASKFRRLARDC